MTPVVGADIAKGAWVAARVERGSLVAVREYALFAELLADADDCAVVAVDVPIGLLEVGWRGCDAAGKRMLGRRSSTLFATPPRSVLAAPTYAEARQRAMSLTGKSVSAQAFALRAKILEVDGFAGDPRLREVHPELSFAAMAGAVVAEAKTSWNGLMRRRQLLAQQGLAVPDRVEDAPTAAPDDILDAVAAAWTAMRVDAGRAERIGEPGPEPAIWR